MNGNCGLRFTLLLLGQREPDSDFLFPPPAGTMEAAPKPGRVELGLFDSLDELG